MEKYIAAVRTTLVVFGLLVVLTRIVGRKLLSQITFFNFVIGVTIGTVGGGYIVNRAKGGAVLLSPIVLVLCTLALSYLVLKSLKFRKLILGEPIVIIQNGKILEENMYKARYTLDSLRMQLREKDVFDIKEVEFAILEPDGELSVLKKSYYDSITRQDLGLDPDYKGLETEIIKDGQVLEQNLIQNNLDFNWLYNELNKQGIEDVSRVMLATLNTDGSLYVDLKDEPPDYTQKVED
mgnify:CR=1 FL=1